MFKNVFKETASTRALAGIINSLEIEIVARRDTICNHGDKSALRMFIIARNAFQRTWNIMVPETDSVSYAIAWDDHLNSAVHINNRKIEELVVSYMNSILDDVSVDLYNLLPHFSINTIHEREAALVQIVNIDKTFSLV